MDFKLCCLLLTLTTTVSCVRQIDFTKGDENIIGVRLDKMSSLVNFEGQESEEITIFDEKKRRIHQFQLSDMAHLRTLKVREPEQKHVVVAHEKGHFVVDLFDQHLSVFGKQGQVEHDPLQFSGNPVSVAFRSELNLFIMYDDLNSVGIMKLDNYGNILKRWVGGPVLKDDSTITSGDLLANGNMALGLSNGNIALVDIEQSLLLEKWKSTEFNPSLGKISWVGPVRDKPNQIFVKAGNEIALIDVVAQIKLDSVVISGANFEKLSKTFDPHIVVRTSGWQGEITVYYPQNSKIVKRALQKQDFYLLSSQLNLTSDRWSFVESDQKTDWFDNSVNTVKNTRRVKMFRLSDMAALKRMDVAAEAQVLLSSSSLFALFPSDFGYAAKFDLLTGVAKEARMFNVKDMD